LAKSSDGQLLFTGTEKGDIIVWNIAANRLERTLHQPSAVHFVVALKDPREFVAAGSNHLEPQNALVRKWNVATGTFVDLTGIDTDSFPTGLAIDNDAGLIAATTDKGMVIVWNSRTNNQLAQWKTNGLPSAVALLGRNVYVASDGAILKFNPDAQNQPPASFSRVPNREWLSLEPSPDHTLLSAEYEEGNQERVAVIDPVAKSEIANFDSFGSTWLDASKLMLFSWMDPVEVVQISRKGQARSIRKFKRMESDTPGRAFGLNGAVSNAQGSKAWASYTKGPGLLEFDLSTNKIKTLLGGPSGAYSISVSTQDNQTGELLTGGADGYVRLWNLAGFSLVKEHKVAKAGYYVSRAYFVPGSRSAVVEVDRITTPEELPGASEVVFLDLETGQQKKLFDLYSWRARTAIVDGKILYPEGPQIKFRNLDGSQDSREFSVGSRIGATAVSANRRRLVTVDDTSTMTVFDLNTGQKKSISVKLDDIGPLVVTDDGVHVHSVADGGELIDWNIDTGEVTRSLLTIIRDMHTRVDFLNLANSDRWLVTAGNHHDVGIFDRATNRLVFFMQVSSAVWYVEKVWISGNRMIVTTDTGVMYDGILK
jgi:WD40 repeat protein